MMRKIILLLLIPACGIAQQRDHYESIEDFTSKIGVNKFWVDLTEDGMGRKVSVPVIVIKGSQPGPVLGINAAIHGNELNGVPIIYNLIDTLSKMNFKGTIIAIPGMNVPGILGNEREFPDGQDLNRIMPGKSNGNESNIYANRFFERVAKHFQYFVDLHTASFGRLNTHYVRADLSNEKLKSWAMAQNANLVLNSVEASTTGGSGTLRAALADQDIPGITIELGDPQVWQNDKIRNGFQGILNIIVLMGMVEGQINVFSNPILCSKSYWIYSDSGGLLNVLPNIMQKVEKGDKIAILKDPFGDIIKEYFAPEAGYVIGKSSNPVTPSGGRILHLGIELTDSNH